MKVGIDKLGLYIPLNYVDMKELAIKREIDPDKFIIGIGQEKMSVPTIEHDIVALGANAALQILSDDDREKIDQVIFATESSFDFSKSAATHVHQLLNINPYAKSFEIKQACYGGTAGLMAAVDYVRLNPERKVLVVTADIARYGLNTPGESTQGAGAIAMLISSDPNILAIEPYSISYTENQYDFWRPSYSKNAIVDGKFSTELYNHSFEKVMTRLEKINPEEYSQLKSIVFHLPFSKMGKKALNHYKELETRYIKQQDKDLVVKNWEKFYPDTTILSRTVGNIYTGSVYLSLISLLIFAESLNSGDKIGLFSYGSGSVSELLLGTIQPKYLETLKKEKIIGHFSRRQKITVDEYEEIFNQMLPEESGTHQIVSLPIEPGFYLKEINNHKRSYAYYPHNLENEKIRY